MKNAWQNGLLLITLSVLFLLSLRPLAEFDTYFGLKIGQLILTTHSFPTQEVFSWSAQGRDWITYEWLFQTEQYLLSQLFGFGGVSVFVALATTSFFLLGYYLFRACLSRSTMGAYLLSLGLTASIYEYFVARPQLVNYLGFLAILVLIFLFLFRRKNLFILLLPICYIWTNSHASFPLLFYLLVGFGLSGWLFYRHQDPPFARRISKTFGSFTLLSLVVSILPPLWLKPYLLVFEFAKDLKFLTIFINEWAPLSSNPPYLVFYLLLFGITIFLCLWFSLRQKQTGTWVLALPLVPLVMLPFQSIRHYPLGCIALFVLLGLFLPKLTTARKWRFAVGTLIAFTIGLSLFFITLKRQELLETATALPQNAVAFLKTHHLQGRMYNQLGLGGYFDYYLYPTYHVFFDGRAEVFRCCEMRAFLPLILAHKNDPSSFPEVARRFLNRYDFSYAVIPIDYTDPLIQTTNERMADYLLTRKNWHLIYFDDQVEIYLRDDGKNTALLQRDKLPVLTPHNLSGTRRGRTAQAIGEYKAMIKRQDSGIARANLSLLYLESGRKQAAYTAASRALTLAPRLGIPSLVLGELAAQSGDLSLGESLLTQAIALEPTLGEAYVALAEVYLSEHQPTKARSVTQQGLSQPIDLRSRQTLVRRSASLD